ncbi:MAG: hypothetical protein LC808_00515 [Actinobacteria bacterium]|nr:hypothetical protein [Actinomycetota bacterium]
MRAARVLASLTMHDDRSRSVSVRRLDVVSPEVAYENEAQAATVTEPARERAKDDPLWCQWSSTSHAPSHKIAEPGLPFCLYHIAAVFGMARGASTPDPKTRAVRPSDRLLRRARGGLP